ncbi:MAG TPA: ATP-binding protein [Verrucomicrobiae bacterium]|nr:ATP-binding protein [Verrucomicrobiae bacterium]
MARHASSLVVASHFIEATRDSGYKSLGSALAELIDNSFEAKATRVAVVIGRVEGANPPESHLRVSDNGSGMDANTCSNAMRFGWSSRFNQRNSHGRYGMGLPNASLSHARRIEILTSCDGKSARATYLDADEFSSGGRESVPAANEIAVAEFRKVHPFKHGTTVVWRKCDRLENRYLGPLVKRLGLELGRLFRFQLWAGKHITLNGDPLRPLDPLFERQGCGLTGANAFGPELTYEVASTDGNGKAASSVVKVRFTELPVEKWHVLSNREKNVTGIAKGAGVSIVRAGREIDRGWFFMGQKRRENYDDWWRCEVCFEPDVDELFGVTHTKQEIHPTEKLNAILTPDMERTARELNGRARKAFVMAKSNGHIARDSERLAERFDNLIEPPTQATRVVQKAVVLRRGGRGRVGGLEYRFHWEKLDQLAFYLPSLDGACLKVVLNEQHPFVRQACAATTTQGDDQAGEARRNLELAILAAARAEVSLAKNKQARGWSKTFRESWSNILATFLS